MSTAQSKAALSAVPATETEAASRAVDRIDRASNRLLTRADSAAAGALLLIEHLNFAEALDQAMQRDALAVARRGAKLLKAAWGTLDDWRSERPRDRAQLRWGDLERAGGHFSAAVALLDVTAGRDDWDECHQAIDQLKLANEHIERAVVELVRAWDDLGCAGRPA